MGEDIKIIEYRKEFHEDFKKLNLEWLDQYHLTESHDLLILDDPQATILDSGGFIWLATFENSIIGTAALIKEKEEKFELAKMAVTAKYRGRGISKLLLEACLTKAREMGAKTLTLVSNHQLNSALKLYEKYGFYYIDIGDSPFKTADIKMQLRL